MEKIKLINEPIFWEGTIEDLKKQKFDRKQKFRFYCRDCGKENTVSFDRIKKSEELLCRNCALKRTHIKNYGSFENYKKALQEKQNKTNLERYGTTNPNSLPEIQEKIKQTNLERYGYESSNSSPEVLEKRKKTCIEKYGVDNPNKSQIVKDKIKQTNREKYGCDSYTQTEEYIEKTKATNLKKYGVEWSRQNKEVVEKGIQTTRERYGVDNVSQSPEIQAKKIQTCQKHYGVDFPFQSEEVKEITKKNNLEKWGVEFPQTLEEVKERQAQTNLEKYGTVSTAQSHYSEKTKEIVFDKNKFIDFMDNEANKNVEYASILLGIENSTVRTYIYKYNLEERYLNQTVRSCQEEELKAFLTSLNIKFVFNRKDIIEPLELDLYLPDYNIAIEFNGNYWHSDIKKYPEYHASKSQLCESKGIRLIHIFEYEWDFCKEKILNYLKDILCPRIKIDSENCEVKEIPQEEAKIFLEQNDIQEYKKDSIRIGLYNNKDLLEVMTFAKTKENEYEIFNHSVKFGYDIKQGINKLFEYFKKIYSPKKVTARYNRDKFTKSIYENIGLELKEISSPDYIWILPSKDIILSKLHELGKIEGKEYSFNMDENLIRDAGFLKIYNSGYFVFEKEYD